MNSRNSDSVLRVVLTGAESTGKTTLARLLAAHYGTAWVPEYVRTFVEEKGADPVYDDLETIVKRHLDLEDDLARRADRILICDTNPLSTWIYAHYYFGGCPASIEQAISGRRYDLYLLMGDEIPWVPDPGQRDSPETRTLLQGRFEAELHGRAFPYVRVTGSLEERLHAAVAAIRPLLEDAPAGSEHDSTPYPVPEQSRTIQSSG